MAHAFVGTTELLQIGDGNISDINVSELLEEAPMLAILAAIEASNETSHEWLKKTAAPTAGFREVNDGRETTKAVYTKVTQSLKLFDASFDLDIALLKASSGDKLMRREAVDHLKAAFASVEKQLLYGVDNDEDGFDGFIAEPEVADVSGAMVVDAGGTEDGEVSSVWAIRTGESAVSVVYGGGGRIQIGDPYKTLRAGSVAGNYDAMRTPIIFWAGCQVATTLDIARIVNLTDEEDKGLTDDLLAELIAKFPAGRKPTHLVMNRRSHKQLQQSRTAVNPTGAPAPFPTEAFGIPIVVTDQISSTEDLVVAPSSESSSSESEE